MSYRLKIHFFKIRLRKFKRRTIRRLGRVVCAVRGHQLYVTSSWTYTHEVCRRCDYLKDLRK